MVTWRLRLKIMMAVVKIDGGMEIDGEFFLSFDPLRPMSVQQTVKTQQRIHQRASGRLVNMQKDPGEASPKGKTPLVSSPRAMKKAPSTHEQAVETKHCGPQAFVTHQRRAHWPAAPRKTSSDHAVNDDISRATTAPCNQPSPCRKTPTTDADSSISFASFFGVKRQDTLLGAFCRTNDN